MKNFVSEFRRRSIGSTITSRSANSGTGINHRITGRVIHGSEYITWEDLHAEVGKMTQSIDRKFDQIMDRTDDISKSVTAIERTV